MIRYAELQHDQNTKDRKMIEALDHVNLQTQDLDAMVAWYTEVLGLRHGDRPDFPFPGAWLYAGDHPIVHVTLTDEVAKGGGALSLEHAAFRAKGLAGFLDRLEARGETYKVVHVEFLPIVLVNVWDPDGNHLHIDFPRAEAEAAGITGQAAEARVAPVA